VSRRAGGEGTIRFRADGRYEAIFWVVEGDPRRRRDVYGSSAEEAARMLRAALTARDRGQATRGTDTLAAHTERWLDSARRSVRPVTLARYRQVMHKHMLPTLGRKKLVVLVPPHVSRRLHEALEEAGLPRIRFHDLRHTAANLLLGSDLHPRKVGELLGHSSSSITLDTYSHVTATMQSEVAAAMDQLLQGRPRVSTRRPRPPPPAPCTGAGPNGRSARTARSSARPASGVTSSIGPSTSRTTRRSRPACTSAGAQGTSSAASSPSRRAATATRARTSARTRLATSSWAATAGRGWTRRT
jgi:hypothetical protein